MKKFILSCLAAPLFALQLNAQQKPAVVDADAIYAVYSEVARADSAIVIYTNDLAKARNELEEMYQYMLKRYIDDSARMSPTIKKAEWEKVLEKGTAIRVIDKNYGSYVDAFKQEVNQKLRKKMEEAIHSTAKELGYNMVFYTQQLFSYPRNADITELVKKKLGITN